MTTFDVNKEASVLSDRLDILCLRLASRGDAAAEFVGEARRLWKRASRVADALNGPEEPPDAEDMPPCDPIADQRMDSTDLGHD